MSSPPILDGQHEPVAIVGMGEISSPYDYSKAFSVLNSLIHTQDVDGLVAFEMLLGSGIS